jgi:hypothetical protein
MRTGKSVLSRLAVVSSILLVLAFIGCGTNNATTGNAEAGAGDGSGMDGPGGGGDASPFDGNVFNGDGGCLKFGGGCTNNSECCSGTCKGGVCSFPTCVSDNQA